MVAAVRTSEASARAEKPLRVGVIGAGVMGSNHARVFMTLPGVRLVGIADPLEVHRKRAVDLIGCRTFIDINSLLAEGVDAVTIAAPTHLHHEIALNCIARKIDVLVEKPIASTVEEGREIVAAAKRAGVTLMVGHVERFNPAVATIKDALRGEDILSIAITRVGPFPPRMSNVGVVIDLAVHDIDLIRWFTESDIIEVQPQLKSAVAEREDIALLAVPHRLRRARAHQHQLADSVQGAQRHGGDPRQVHHGRSVDTPGHRVFRIPARRQLFDAAPVGWLRRAAA